MDNRISQELLHEGLRIADTGESGWYWKSINENGDIVTLWVTDEMEDESQ